MLFMGQADKLALLEFVVLYCYLYSQSNILLFIINLKTFIKMAKEKNIIEDIDNSIKSTEIDLLKRRLSLLENDLRVLTDRMEKLYQNSEKIDIIHAKTTDISRENSTLAAAIKSLGNDVLNLTVETKALVDDSTKEVNNRIDSILELIESGENTSNENPFGLIVMSTPHQPVLHRLKEGYLNEAISLQKENPSYLYFFIKSIKKDNVPPA
jgi:outer membrane murein-binding lipoprotein Lpp